MDMEVEINDDVDDAENFQIIEEKSKTSDKFTGYYHNRIGAKNEKYIMEHQQLSFEVDFDIFESKFWPKVGNRKNMKKISPTLVWTEIYSVIKGGLKSSTFYMGYLPKQLYNKSEGSDFLTCNEKKTIYYLFLEYEKWKAEQHAYDFMDVVNHL